MAIQSGKFSVALTIPVELFRPIMRALGVDRRALAVLARSCRFLYAEAMGPLYNSITDSSASDADLHTAFLSSLTDAPHLGSLVSVYHSVGIIHHEQSAMWGLLHRAFGCMTNLKTLHLQTYGRIPASALLLNAPFQLEHLYLGTNAEGWPIATVLQQQRALRYLYLQVQAGVSFPLACCPDLKELAGNRDTLEGLLPGRRVEHVVLVPAFINFMEERSDWDVEYSIAPALMNIRTLSFGAFFDRPNLCVIVNHLTQLEQLELVGLLENELFLLEQIPSLRELVVSFNWGSSFIPIPADAQYRQHLVGGIFASCPNLRYVEIACERGADNSEVWYERWSRDELQAPPQFILTNYVKCRRFSTNCVQCIN
ncbi:hypothetical protein BDN70DRAFT_997605 [Pholiota conissans]|uniref:Uncharacterized protein n=1 Tax=Pholiota conissans TaxID=109636 RepID=A0A9P6CP30_9AGAR|nr:hypothetical protein BDN70DRAFT_997605 [Pholiota conissans]